MNIKKDKNIIALIIVLGVFTLGYFLIANRISYAFSNNPNLESSYENTNKIITTSAIVYGNADIEELKEKKVKWLTIQELIDEKYLIPDENGNVVNPLEPDKTINAKKVESLYY